MTDTHLKQRKSPTV